MDKVYNFRDFEDTIDELWNSHNAFAPNLEGITQQEPFVVVIPPPNVTGVLHMGHALNNNLQDILSRYYRMTGRTTLWVPGSDHAGIATQQIMERKLKEEGTTRHDLGREAFIDRTQELAYTHKISIVRQLHKIGASCDWTRERFTLDDKLSNAVKEVFVHLYEKGLIYKDEYLINWSVDAGTAISDDEVVYKEVQGALYHIHYPFETAQSSQDNSTGVVIATTRPETLLGDVALAVHPDDSRYQHLIGAKVQLPLVGRTIPIIADEFVDQAFGSGVVKITPAHDKNDFEVAKRHNLEYINILNIDGTLNDTVPNIYRGLPVKEARKQVIQDLQAQELMIKEEPYLHKVGHCYRTDCVIEPLVSSQWFVRMSDMAQKALHALENDEIRFYPKRWENTYTHWLKNIKDWCISRQLWWGHRIPVWYNDETGEVIVSRDDPTKDPKYEGVELRQEEDVLDTWFSSWIWPFSVMGWPEHTDDFKHFYPTSTLVTAYDIIFFWVARMVMAGIEFTGQVPFRDIYLHGLVRDDKGRKMSKSLGNGIDPLQIVEECGADALKFTLAYMCKLGGDVLLNKDHFQLGSKFANKVWNASRFLLLNLREVNYVELDDLTLNSIDKWLVSKMRTAMQGVHTAITQYRFDDASHVLYEYFWTDFCDWYVEAIKFSLQSEGDTEKQRSALVLLWVLIQNLKLLHPFLPFITEEIYQNIRSHIYNPVKLPRMLATAQYCTLDEKYCFYEDSNNFTVLQELVTGVRTLRSEFNIHPKATVVCRVYADTEQLQQYFNEQSAIISSLIRASKVEILTTQGIFQDNEIGVESAHFTAMVDIKEYIDSKKELLRIEKKRSKLIAQQESINQRLNNTAFREKAHRDYIEEIEKNSKALEKKIIQLDGFIERLQQ